VSELMTGGVGGVIVNGTVPWDVPPPGAGVKI
jgi:hypothetical protein